MTLIAAYLLWQRELLLGLAVAILPAVATTAIVITYADFEKARNSSFGRYVRGT